METQSKRNLLISSPSGSSGGARVKLAMMGDNLAVKTSNANKRAREEEKGEVPQDGGAEEQAGYVPAQRCKIYVATRCTPLRFARTVPGLNEAKRDAVHSLGLGGLLKIKPYSLDVQLIKNLVNRFDTVKATLKVHGRVILANVFEVGRLLGLPTHGTSIERFRDSDKGNLLELRIRYNLGQGLLKLSDLKKSLADAEGEEFRARFLLMPLPPFFPRPHC